MVSLKLGPKLKLKNFKNMVKYVFIDVETTGVNHWQHCVHQIAGGVYIDDKLIESFDFKIKPHELAKISEEALAVSNLTIDTVNDYPHRSIAYKGLIDILAKNCNKFDKQDKYFFVAYNAHFDNQFVRAFFAQNNDNYFGSWFWSNSIDVMVLAAEYLKDKRHLMVDFKLKTVATTLGIEIDESKLHDGFYDIELTKKVYDKIINK